MRDLKSFLKVLNMVHVTERNRKENSIIRTKKYEKEKEEQQENEVAGKGYENY